MPGDHFVLNDHESRVFTTFLLFWKILGAYTTFETEIHVCKRFEDIICCKFADLQLHGQVIRPMACFILMDCSSLRIKFESTSIRLKQVSLLSNCVFTCDSSISNVGNSSAKVL